MNLYLHLEILNREFESKLLIAMESASKGMKVYLGRLKPYLMRDFFAPGIILDKSLTPSPFKLRELRGYKKKNFIVTGLDEEVGLVNDNPKDYLKIRYSKESLDLTDRVFTWGEYDYNNLSIHSAVHNEQPAVVNVPVKQGILKKKDNNIPTIVLDNNIPPPIISVYSDTHSNFNKVPTNNIEHFQNNIENVRIFQ